MTLIGARRYDKIRSTADAERILSGLIKHSRHPQHIPALLDRSHLHGHLSYEELQHLSRVMREAEMVKGVVGMLPEFGPQFTPRDEYEPPFVGRTRSRALRDCREELSLVYGQYSDALKSRINGVEDLVLDGQMQTAIDLGVDPTEVGCDSCNGHCVGFSLPNPIKIIDKAAGGVLRTARKLPVTKQALSVADRILNNPVASTIQKIASNPVVSTVLGNVALPVAFGMAAAKGGAQGALNHARKELKNPVRGLAIKAVAIVFPPTAPAAAGLEAVNRVLDAAESGDTAAAAKATAQIAATYALGELGDPGALKAVQYFNKAKEMRKNIPKGALTPAGHPRVAVCGARSEEARGVWLKVHFYMDGPFMKATVYTVAGGDAEVFNLSVDTRPIAAAIAKYHKKLHGDVAVSGTLFNNLTTAVKKVGKGKLSGEVFKVSQSLATKAKCKAMTPNMPVSDVALAAFAAARKGVDAVDANKKMKTALATNAANLKKYIAVKNTLSKLPFAKKVEVMKNPTIKAAVLNGIGAKFAAARFVKAGGPEKAKKIRANAIKAAGNFATLARATKSSNPAVAAEAQTMAKVVSIAAKARQKTKNVTENQKGGTAGLVIDSRGKLRKGRFTKRTPGKGELAQVMLTRSGVQTGLFDKVGCADPFDVGVSEEPVPLLGCIGTAAFIGAVRARPPARPTPPNRPIPVRRPAARPTTPAARRITTALNRPLPATNVIKNAIKPKTPALAAISKLPAAKRVAVAKKIVARLTPAQKAQLQKRIAIKKAAMSYQSGSPNLPQYEGGSGNGGGSGGGGASFEEEYGDDGEEELPPVAEDPYDNEENDYRKAELEAQYEYEEQLEEDEGEEVAEDLEEDVYEE